MRGIRVGNDGEGGGDRLSEELMLGSGRRRPDMTCTSPFSCALRFVASSHARTCAPSSRKCERKKFKGDSIAPKIALKMGLVKLSTALMSAPYRSVQQSTLHRVARFSRNLCALQQVFG